MMSSKRNMMMAYAMGIAKTEEKDDERKQVKLSEINPEWENYDLWFNGYKDTNSAYTIYYKGGPFGKEPKYVAIIRIPFGWKIDHAAMLLTTTIDLHKNEMMENEMMEI